MNFMKKWYKVETFIAHVGAGRRDTRNVYIYAENVQEVLSRYHKMPGIKRDFSRHKNCMPSMREMSDEEASDLEKAISSEGRKSLTKSKDTWYYEKLKF